MYFRYAIIILANLPAIAAALIAVSNHQNIAINALGLTQQIEAATLLFAFLIAGVLCGWSSTLWKAIKQGTQDRKIQEWQNQDLKLAAEVKSDREKQLEAKIATLETALKTALKKV